MVVVCALGKRPRDRYPSASALGDALEHANLHPEDTLSVRPSGLTSHPPSSRRAGGDASTSPAGGDQQAILSPLGWTVVALVAAGVGIGIGVWISLRP